MKLNCELLVNSAGLSADGIAEMAGMDPDTLGYRIHPCKGEYFRVSDRHRGRLSHLVYPVPTPVYLGAHAALSLDGTFKIGPSAFYVDEIEYSVDPDHGADFYSKTVKFLPFVEQDDFTPDMSGIRPKLYREGESFRDFVISEESDKGYPGLVNLIGMESPGLTSCLAIGEYVSQLV
jgi:L-2-hydroxyglutarate oxidase LhgO